MRIRGKVAIVTGAAGRIGQAITRRLAAEGADVVVNDISAERAEATAASIREAGGDAIAWAADVSNSAEIRAMVEATVDRFGGIDILVNNAGDRAGLLKRLTLFEHSDDDVCDWGLRLNLKGTMVCIRAVLAPRSRHENLASCCG